jgi:hypothetical protein
MKARWIGLTWLLVTTYCICVWLLIGLAVAAVSRDIRGHPRDIPDAGCYEYSEPTALRDMEFYVIANWLDSTGGGDFNRDGICNFQDYAILASWWMDNREYRRASGNSGMSN